MATLEEKQGGRKILPLVTNYKKSEHYALWVVGKGSLYYYICLVGLLKPNILVFEKYKEGMIINKKEDEHKNKKHLIFRP